MAEKEIRLAVGGDSSVLKKIHKLPRHLRSKEDSDVYDPKVVSIGPYHHGKPQLQLVQGMKRKVLDHFISISKQDYEFYFKKMLEVVHMARSCYILMDDEEFDDDQFAEMMLLDGCFLLNYCLVTTDYGDDVATNKALEYCSPLDIITLVDAAAGWLFIERDTLLLDNQIPLWIIELLFNATYGNANPLHTWKQLLSMTSQAAVWGEIVYENVDELEKHIMLQHHDGAPLHLLEFYHMLMMVSRPSSSSSSEAAAAIGSTPKMSTKEFSDEGIKFNSNLLRAEVKLPVFDANAFTRVYFQNMIAYELCNYRRTQFVVGSYINFMKSLIVSPQDVKELREKCIIRSALGEDKEVVKLFHGLNTHGLENPIIFRDVKHKILNYYNSKTKTWMAELTHTYFRTPWTAIAFFAATSLLVLTFLQTYFTINPRGH
ncbi:UPF0481 protein At3g47200-like [Ipomoea triloba]|uniref:UPF0481 protein At3g47200-like n=1 Tax=Ipomoea triloba TaxID=35885 RepID=UPI00125DA3DE|nr:UPF0481 protein At3g47200-like [Ipomoea triloba]